MRKKQKPAALCKKGVIFFRQIIKKMCRFHSCCNLNVFYFAEIYTTVVYSAVRAEDVSIGDKTIRKRSPRYNCSLTEKTQPHNLFPHIRLS